MSFKTRLGISGRPEIFDQLRHKFVALTPEEEVRQRFITYLIEAKGYPRPLMANEVSVKVSGVTRRPDSVLFGKSSKMPRMIIEYKAPGVNISQQVFDQIRAYNSVLHARYLVVTNGRQTFCCEIDYALGKATFLPEIPAYDALAPED